MPTFAKLTPEEVAALTRRSARTQPDDRLAEYLEFLNDLKVGDWGRLTLEENESQRAVKYRLTTAGRLKGVRIRYQPSGEANQLYFRLEPADTAGPLQGPRER
jgi:hypothetical protein